MLLYLQTLPSKGLQRHFAGFVLTAWVNAWGVGNLAVDKQTAVATVGQVESKVLFQLEPQNFCGIFAFVHFGKVSFVGKDNSAKFDNLRCVLEQYGQWRNGTSGGNVKRFRVGFGKVFRASMLKTTGNANVVAKHGHKVDALGKAIHQGDFDVWAGDFQRQRGKTCTATDIAQRCVLWDGHRAKDTISKVFFPNFRPFRDGGEVVLFVFRAQKVAVELQLLHHFVGKLNIGIFENKLFHWFS